MIKIAVIGSSGYVGSAIYKILASRKEYSATPVTRSNYLQMKKKKFNIIINAAMPSGRFWAENNPKKDFIETVEKTANIIYGWQYQKLIQISTLSARCELDTVYGRHKAAAEKIANFGSNLIFRLGAMFSHDLAKGVLIDILRGEKVYKDRASRYCFADLNFVSNWIIGNIGREGIIEVGAKNSVSLYEIAKFLNKKIKFHGPLETQEVEDPGADFPDAKDVFSYLLKMK